MIKKIIWVLLGVLLLVISVVILYWKDSQFDPSSTDLWLYLFVLPLVLGLLILSPWLLYRAYRAYQNRQQQASMQPQHAQEIPAQAVQAEVPEWLKLNVFAASAYAASGENTDILEAIVAYQSPSLDSELTNSYGLPILSYRIADLVLADDESELALRQQRIYSLIQHQLEQHQSVFESIAAHLNRSALFYDTQESYDYRVHPGWKNEQADTPELESAMFTPPVQQLDRLTLQLFLPEDLLHIWQDEHANSLIYAQLTQYGLNPEQLMIEYQFVSSVSAYSKWNSLLREITSKPNEVYWVAAVDSEIDQDVIDERFWQKENHVPAEFISSCCIAVETVVIEGLEPIKHLNVCKAAAHAHAALCDLNLETHAQYEAEDPFVYVLEPATQFNLSKKLDHFFQQTSIEAHHYLYPCALSADTQQVAKIYATMLAMQATLPPLNVVVSTTDHTLTVIQNPVAEVETKDEAAS